MAGHLINLFLHAHAVFGGSLAPSDSFKSAKHKFTRSAIMPTALQEIRFDCCLIFTRNPRLAIGAVIVALVFIIFYGDRELHSTSIPEGVVYAFLRRAAVQNGERKIRENSEFS